MREEEARARGGYGREASRSAAKREQRQRREREENGSEVTRRGVEGKGMVGRPGRRAEVLARLP